MEKVFFLFKDILHVNNTIIAYRNDSNIIPRTEYFIHNAYCNINKVTQMLIRQLNNIGKVV